MIRPLDTQYRGYNFRSRLEARWAVFFTTLGIVFEYENQGYSLDGTFYLPDFWLPNQNCYVEVKPYTPIIDDEYRAHRLSLEMGVRSFIAFGAVPYPIGANKFDNDSMWGYDAGNYLKNNLWCRCPICKTYNIAHEGYAYRLPCGCTEDTTLQTWDYRSILQAYQYARSERFGF